MAAVASVASSSASAGSPASAVAGQPSSVSAAVKLPSCMRALSSTRPGASRSTMARPSAVVTMKPEAPAAGTNSLRPVTLPARNHVCGAAPSASGRSCQASGRSALAGQHRRVRLQSGGQCRGDQRLGRQRRAHLLGDHAELGHAQPGAARALRHAQADPAHLAHLPQHGRVVAGLAEAQRTDPAQVATGGDRRGAVSDQPQVGRVSHRRPPWRRVRRRPPARRAPGSGQPTAAAARRRWRRRRGGRA